MASGVLAGLDGASALLAAVVGLFFFRVWRKSGLGLDLLLTCSFAFLTLGFGVAFLGDVLAWDPEDVGYPGFSLELAGVLTLLAAYVSARARVRAGPALIVGWGLAGVGVLFALAYVLVPPVLTLTPVEEIAPYAHAATATAWGACAMFASTAWAKRRVAARATVALGYFALALGYYTWALLGSSTSESQFLLGYLWRLAGLVLVGLAVVLPSRGGADAQA